MRPPGGRATQGDRASSLRKAQSRDVLRVAGCLRGSFIELGGAGRGWPPTWKGTQGRKPSSGLAKRVPGPFHVTSSSTNHGRKRDSVKAEQEQRPGVMPGPEHLVVYNLKCKLIEKWQGKGQCCFSFFSESPENTNVQSSDVIKHRCHLRPERM